MGSPILNINAEKISGNLTATTITTTGLSAFTNSISGFSVFNTTGGTPMFSVNTVNGRVGIQMGSPANTLDVNGNINARNSIGQTGGYYINNNLVIQQGPTGYGNSTFVWGSVSTTGYNVFTHIPLGICTSGASLSLRNVLTVAQSQQGFGTIASATGSTSLTGTNTSFLTTFNIGDTIRFGTNTYTITAITNDTLLTLATTASTATSSQTYFLNGGERFYISGNGNIRSQSNSVSGFTITNQSGGTPTLMVDTKNFVNSAITVSLTGRLYNALSPNTGSTSQTINWATNNVFDFQISAATTFTFSNVIPGQSIVVAVRQPGGGTGFNYSFSGSTVYWPGGATPTPTTTTGKTDIYTFVSLSASTIYGSVLQNF